MITVFAGTRKLLMLTASYRTRDLGETEVNELP
jgi:hypothetical protein